MGRSIYISTESDDTQVLPDSLPNFKYPPFLGLIVNKQSSGTAKASCLDSIMYVVSAATGALAALALLSWVIFFLINPDNPLLGGTSLALAPVIAIFGAFGWAGGMSFKADPGLRANLRKIGIAYTMTAFFLVIMGMLSPVIEVADPEATGYYYLAVPYVGLTFLGAFSFGIGTWKLTNSVVGLWKFRDG